MSYDVKTSRFPGTPSVAGEHLPVGSPLPTKAVTRRNTSKAFTTEDTEDTEEDTTFSSSVSSVSSVVSAFE